MDRYEKFAQWQEAGYIDPDSLSCTDAATPFESGLSASYVGTLDDYVGVKDMEQTLGEGSWEPKSQSRNFMVESILSELAGTHRPLLPA